ncbi:MAG: sigma-70 family RNA polymerase sigma factor, partial [Candidatus Hydrogenedentes bacterium]|nr:sigma-70 family RNA polymerase sigma factor [Candidatus Hydrogenedentota bacterium]
KFTETPAASADTALVRRAQAGDVHAFESLVRLYRNDVYALSYHFLRNREEAWDVSQEVFIKVYRSLKHFRGEASFKSWLLRITANQCKDQLKKRRLDTVPFEDALKADAPGESLGPGRQSEASELGAVIERAVASLPPKHRTAFILREMEGLSYQEMAEAMGCNLGTVMSRLHHARKKLQEALAGMGVVEGMK